MSLTPALFVGLPLLVGALMLALYPWRRASFAFVFPGAVLLACAALSLRFEHFAKWLVFLGLPTAVALTGLIRAGVRVRASR